MHLWDSCSHYIEKLDKEIAQSAGAVEYTDCISSEGKKSITSVLDMTLNNLMVRFQ